MAKLLVSCYHVGDLDYVSDSWLMSLLSPGLGWHLSSEPGMGTLCVSFSLSLKKYCMVFQVNREAEGT